MRVLENLEPAAVFGCFEEICRIPHTSFHEKQISDYCFNFARERGYDAVQDEMGNLLITAPATPGYEEAAGVIIQGHMDMVGDKLPDCPIDMEKDGLDLFVDGDLIGARGTTLGGDDGIAVAYALALLEDKTIPHPHLEIVLTVGEEVGLIGASAMDLSACKGRRLINIDSEVEGILTVSCAGGKRAKCLIPVKREVKSGNVYRIILRGLLGGHSGIDIAKGHANANLLLGRFLLMLRKRTGFSLISLEGGAKDNVIPKDGEARILLCDDAAQALAETEKQFAEEMRAEFGKADPDICLKTEAEGAQETAVLDEDSADRVLMALNLMPNGVQAMSMDIEGLVESSMNMGVAKLGEAELEMHISIRSSVSSAKEYMAEKVVRLTELLGGTTEFSGDYPAWPFARESQLRDLCVEVFKKQYGKEPAVEAIHAGLECGILAGKVPGLDCISFGPDQYDIHTPNERLSISSVARVWEYLRGILAAK